MTTEERLRSVIHKYTETIEPAQGGWERILDRTAVRHRRARWQPAVAAAAVVVLAVVVAAVAVVRSDDRDGTRVQTPPAGSTSAPSEIVAATEDGRVVVLDTATGAELRSLADGADAQTTIAVAPDGARVFFDRLNGPDADPPREIATVAANGGEAQRLIGGAGQPAVSPDGRLLAFVTYSPRTDQGQANGLNVVEIPETFEGWIPNVVGAGTVGEADQQITGVSWAPDSRQLVYTLLFSPQGSYPRVTEVAFGVRLDEAPIVQINDGSDVAGYLGDTGEMLGRTCVATNEPDQRLRVIVLDPQSGQETRHLFRYPELCGRERLSSDVSGRHVLAQGGAGLYRWSEGDAEPTRVADGILAAAWMPGVKSAPAPASTSVPEAPAPVPPDGALPAEIVAARDGRISVIDSMSGQELRTLVGDAPDVSGVSVSPDGGTVYFSVMRADPGCATGGAWEVAAVPRGGGAPTKIADGRSPLVSPDGKTLLFGSPTGRCGPHSEIGLLDLESNEVTTVPRTPHSITWPDVTLDVEPLAWAPSSLRFIYRGRPIDGTQPRLFIGDRDGQVGGDFASGATAAAYPGREDSSFTVAAPTQLGFTVQHLDGSSTPVGRLFDTSGPAPTFIVFDGSGRHLLVVAGGDLPAVYRWSEGEDQPTKIADGVSAAAWLP